MVLGCPETGWFKLASDEVRRGNAIVAAHVENVDESVGADAEFRNIAVKRAKDIDNLLPEHISSPGEINRCVEDLVRIDSLHMIQQFILHDLITQLQLAHNDMFEIACSSGALGTLKWMHSNWPVSTATQANVDAAILNNQTDVVDWMVSIGINIVPSQEAINAAAGLHNVGMLKAWCHTWGVFPNQDGANEAAKNGDLLTLQWMSKHNILPSQYGANEAAKNGDLLTLRWMSKHNTLLDEDGAYWAARSGDLAVQQWIKSKLGIE